jgi:hypothetical protein
MKSIFIILIVFITGLIIYSCDDSLGYDPNVKITKINVDNGDDNENPFPPQKFKVDSIQYLFKEVDNISGSYWDKYFEWKHRIIKSEFFLDTSHADLELWIELEMENNQLDKEHLDSGRVDRVTRFELLFNAPLTGPSFWLMNKQKDRRWLKLYIRNMEHNKEYEYNGSELWGPSLFISENNRSKGQLKLILSTDIRTKDKLRVEKFFGYINLFYKTP